MNTVSQTNILIKQVIILKELDELITNRRNTTETRFLEFFPLGKSNPGYLYSIYDSNLTSSNKIYSNIIDGGINDYTMAYIIGLWVCLEVGYFNAIEAADFRRRGRWRVAPSTITPYSCRDWSYNSS